MLRITKQYKFQTQEFNGQTLAVGIFILLMGVAPFGGNRTFFLFFFVKTLFWISLALICLVVWVNESFWGYLFWFVASAMIGAALLILILYLILGRQRLMKTTAKGIKDDSVRYVEAYGPFEADTSKRLWLLLRLPRY